MSEIPNLEFQKKNIFKGFLKKSPAKNGIFQKSNFLIPKKQGHEVKYIYHFGPNGAEGSKEDFALLGGKGANLAEMSRLGLKIPPGFTLTTSLCDLFLKTGEKLPADFKKPITQAVRKLEKITGKSFDGKKRPLLLSARSGAAVSMPGMMDTILNLGLNEERVEILAKDCKDERFAWDSYRRFIQMYSTVVMDMNSSLLEVHLEDLKNQKGYKMDSEIKAEEWKKIVKHFKEAILENTGQLFPEDPWEQLFRAIDAVFKSWNSPRAKVYRDMNKESHHLGTAVNIQSMVFGNMGEDCATGVVFTRNPSTGENKLFGEFLRNAQGEDVVAGVRTPLLIENEKGGQDLKSLMPEIFQELKTLCKKLESHYKFAQDIEFTIEKNELFILQTRNAKCNAGARLKILFDLKDEGLLTEKDVLLGMPPQSLNSMLHLCLDGKAKKKALAKGLPASPGASIGQIVFDNQEALELSKKGISIILVKQETSPEDISGMIHSKGILTLRGGMTSHAAVVARSMGKPCVVGMEGAHIDEKRKELHIGNEILKEGQEISLDGFTGEVFLGRIKTKEPVLDESFYKLISLSEKYSELEVRANAETPLDVKKAKEFGARGLGLCRTEHMFFAPERLKAMRRMIFSSSFEEREEALKELFSMQKEDFEEIFSLMSPYPVTVRFLDPPLHEFLPETTEEVKNLATTLDWSEESLKIKLKNFKESNPMLGHRGSRLAITFPEIYLMQTRALSMACHKVLKEGGQVKAEIMLPLICSVKEFEVLKDKIKNEIKKIEEELGVSLPILIGTMIELPRACLEAGKLALLSDFFSFGTNDLTQTVFGFSRDDTSKFLPSYIQENILEKDPFSELDEEGVGELIRIAINKARRAKKDIKIGVCGEHGGDARSLEFFHSLGLDYVSCSPYRIPLAKLAAAQAKIKEQQG